MITEQRASTLAQRFQADGFVAVPGLFRPEEMAPLKSEARRILDGAATEARGRGADPAFLNTGVYVGLSQRSAAFRALAGDERLLDVLEPVVGHNILFWSDKVVFKSDAADFGTPWHQDWPYWKGNHKISVWIALDDATEANGCLKFVRGSHLLPVDHATPAPAGQGFGHRVEESTIDAALVVAVPAEAGTAVLFHDLTLHASFPNTTKADRWAVVSTFKDAAAEDLDYPFATAARVVRGAGRT